MCQIAYYEIRIVLGKSYMDRASSTAELGVDDGKGSRTDCGAADKGQMESGCVGLFLGGKGCAEVERGDLLEAGRNVPAVRHCADAPLFGEIGYVGVGGGLCHFGIIRKGSHDGLCVAPGDIPISKVVRIVMRDNNIVLGEVVFRLCAYPALRRDEQCATV